MSLELPVISQFFLQSRASTAGFSICAVICSHNCLYISLLYQAFKCRQIRFFHIFCRCLCIKLMSDRFRSGMHCKMLCTCRSFHSFSITLKSFYKSYSKLFGQIRIFPVSFMASAPSRITENIYIGGPECQSFINISVFFTGICIVFCTSFCCYNICHFSYAISVKCGSHANCLRKYSCLSCPGYPVKSFIPPIISRDTKSLYSRRIIF